MCGICGFWSLNGGDVSKKLKKTLLAISHRGPDGVGIYVDGHLRRTTWSSISIPKGSLAIGHAHLAIVGEIQPILNEDESLVMVHNGEVYNYLEMRSKLEKQGHIFSYKTDSEVLIHSLESNLLSDVRGDYALAVFNKNEGSLHLYRDFPGVRPLFYCYQDKTFSFCSERKGLRGQCEEIKELPPGHKLTVSEDGLALEKFIDVKDLTYSMGRVESEDKAVRLLKRQLEESLKSMCYPKIAIPFSGGLDSSIVALLTSKLCGEVRLFTAGFKGSLDLKNAREAAKLIDLELEIVQLDNFDFEWLLDKTVYHIEDWNPIKVSIGLPLFAVFHRMRELGYKVALTGQGADELFGGYARYLNLKDLESELIKDLLNLHSNNLNRDDHISMANSIEVRYPFLHHDVIKIALNIPSDLKVKDGIRKYILRKTAIELGLPKKLAFREKKAVQYGSGVMKVLRRYAKEKGLGLSDLLIRIYNKFYET